MVEPTLRPHTTQTVYLVYVPARHVYDGDLKKWFEEYVLPSGAIVGKDCGSWLSWPGDKKSMLRDGFAFFWFADSQTALMFSLRWC